MGSRIYTTIATVNGISIYSGNGDPNGVLSATRGSVYSDKLTGDVYTNTTGAAVWVALGGGGARSTFVWRGAGPSDPANGIYDTFAGAQAAASAVEGFKTIVCDHAGITYNIPAGAYNMDNIQLLGEGVSSTSIVVDDGATFTNWMNGAPFCSLEFNTTTVPAITITAGTAQTMRSGEASSWSTANTAGLGISPILIEATAVLIFLVDNLSSLTGDIDTPNRKEIFEISALGALQVNIFNRCNLSNRVFSGAGLLQVFLSGGQYEGTLPVSDPNFVGAGSSVPVGSFYYSPSNLSNWSGVDPENTGAALDRIVSAGGIRRPLVDPGAFTGVYLNAPTPGTFSQPVPGLTLSATYAAARLYYGELTAAPGAVWSRISRIQPFSPLQGFMGFGVGIQMSLGTYIFAGIANISGTGYRSQQVSEYTAAGVYIGPLIFAPNPPSSTYFSVWDEGCYFQTSYDAAANTLGLGPGELTFRVSMCGYNWFTMPAIAGNLAAKGAISGIGLAAQLSLGQAGSLSTFAITSWETP